MSDTTHQLVIPLNESHEGSLGPLTSTYLEIYGKNIFNRNDKIVNDPCLIHNSSKDSFGRREIVILRRGQSKPMAEITIFLYEGKYKCVLHEKMKGKTAKIDISVQKKTA